MFKKLNDILDLKLSLLKKQLKEYTERNPKKEWDLETGEKFNDLINRYAISEDELLSISETVCKFVTITRKTNIDEYLFIDKELERPRLPYMSINYKINNYKFMWNHFRSHLDYWKSIIKNNEKTSANDIIDNLIFIHKNIEKENLK